MYDFQTMTSMSPTRVPLRGIGRQCKLSVSQGVRKLGSMSVSEFMVHRAACSAKKSVNIMCIICCIVIFSSTLFQDMFSIPLKAYFTASQEQFPDQYITVLSRAERQLTSSLLFIVCYIFPLCSASTANFSCMFSMVI